MHPRGIACQPLNSVDLSSDHTKSFTQATPRSYAQYILCSLSPVCSVWDRLARVGASPAAACSKDEGSAVNRSDRQLPPFAVLDCANGLWSFESESWPVQPLCPHHHTAQATELQTVQDLWTDPSRPCRLSRADVCPVPLDRSVHALMIIGKARIPRFMQTMRWIA